MENVYSSQIDFPDDSPLLEITVPREPEFTVIMGRESMVFTDGEFLPFPTIITIKSEDQLLFKAPKRQCREAALLWTPETLEKPMSSSSVPVNLVISFPVYTAIPGVTNCLQRHRHNLVERSLVHEMVIYTQRSKILIVTSNTDLTTLSTFRFDVLVFWRVDMTRGGWREVVKTMALAGKTVKLLYEEGDLVALIECISCLPSTVPFIPDDEETVWERIARIVIDLGPFSTPKTPLDLIP
jgi:hypothetical protein